VVRARKKARGLEKDIAELEAELREEIDELTARYDPDQAKLETLSVKPYRKDIDVELVALLWLPFDELGEKAW
jgi:phosphate uptake regulator